MQNQKTSEDIEKAQERKKTKQTLMMMDENLYCTAVVLALDVNVISETF